MTDADKAAPLVLIAGAGPTGLVLGLCLQRLGVDFRIIDKEPREGTTSRALVVHARTLEFYRQLGVDQAVVQAAQKFVAVNLWTGGKRRARLQFGDIGANLSKYPYSLIFPQDQHEKVLAGALRERGIRIERGVELAGLEMRDDCVACTLRNVDGSTERVNVAYVAGCDGAHSAVREHLGIRLPGGTYAHTWYVADVDMSGPLTNGEVHISMDQRDVLATFPMKEPGTARLIGQASSQDGEAAISFEDVNQRLIAELRSSVSNVRWFSTYRVHHRIASDFRKQRAFLLGDAAHLHSPVGGQGMNTGIGDAVNLAWKLSQVLQNRATDGLLDTYSTERMTFARGLVRTTDAVFAALSSNSAGAQVVRTVLLPAVFPALMRIRIGRRTAFRILSQTAIHYRTSAISTGRAGKVHAGDRLPWIRLTPERDNFEPLNDMRWQVHVYGEAKPSLKSACDECRLALHVFPWHRQMAAAGLLRNAIYLVRPDGHVAFANAVGDAHLLEEYLANVLPEG
ncbi:MAG TPA: FAD-dependent monooxygenase [Candidatus Baltobacteraceae bacterium]